MLLLLSLGVLSRAACTTKFFSLPAVRYGPHVYMLETQSADDICRWMGYSKSGAIKETTLHILGLPVSAITMKPFEINKDRSARILVAVECLKAGQKACTMDKDGNIGTGNKGKNNFGDYNIGDWNIGSSNKGNLNWEGVPATPQEGLPAVPQEGLPAASQEGLPAAPQEGVASTSHG
ncbi:hypothetical protein ACKKBG_A14700 [Auxenochlorella protothecoides x Auxenochlorella symbiontica]